MAEKNEVNNGKKEIERRKRTSRQETEESEDEEKIVPERRTKSRHDKQVVDEQTQAQTQTDDDDTSSNEESDGGIFKKLPSLKMRACPKTLFIAIKKLTTEQKKAVEELGFGSILHLDVKTVPKKLSYWLVDNIDPQSREIKLNNGRRLHFDAEDVSLILGFPRGPRKLAKMKRSEPSSMVDKFRKKLGKEYNRISLSLVQKKMLDEKDGGKWFRRLFMVLLTCCIIENSGNGYVFCQLLQYFHEVNTVREYDWCDYVVRSLVDAAIQWQQRKDRFFTGPIFFLLMFYVDRVESFNRKIPRSVPAFIGWTYRSLCTRQNKELNSGGFGGGYPCQPYTLHDYIRDNPHTGREAKNEDVNDEQMPQPAGQSHEETALNSAAQPKKTKQPSTSIEYADSMMETAKIMADAMVKLMSLVQGAPQQMLEDMFFKKTFDAVQQLLLRKTTASTTQEKITLEQTQTTQDDDEFWANPERIAAIEEIEKANLMRIAYEKEADDIPSFSLGLTQEEGRQHDTVVNDAWENVMHVTRDIQQSEQAQDEIEGDKVTEELQVDADVDATHRRPGKEVMEEGIRMKTRDKQAIKLSEKLMSPYKVRIIDAKETMTKAEGEMYFWVLHNDSDVARHEILYSDGCVLINREELSTLAPNTYISYAVLDVWSTILNHNENFRSKNSPMRFYFTIELCNNTIVNPDVAWNAKKRMNEFVHRAVNEMKAFPWFSLQDIEMFFFPIYKENHFFLICVDVKNIEAFIMDNLHPSEEKATYNKLKYGHIPNLLIKYFIELLKQVGLVEKSQQIRKRIKNMESIQMPWTDETNNVDCGVYVMRHMETFMGVQNWKTGLKKKSRRQLRYLRMKYCAAIISAESNIHKNINAKSSNFYYRESCEDGPIDVAALYLNNLK